MFSIKIPNVKTAEQKTNSLGLTIQDYHGAPSTLCGGCGHDSVTAAIIHACFELSLPPERIVKLSGIGCSSKTPAYFVSAAHGFNSVHGRMPSIATGAYLAHGQLHYIGVSGDGDTGSIGIGQFIHAIRRSVNLAYIVENNGVYGLTKGQFSPTSDLASSTKKGDKNLFEPIDLVSMAIQLGASYVARAFSGDKKQLIPLLKGAMSHRGFALIDVLSPCVSFNDHEGSTKSYQYIRKHGEEATLITDFIPPRDTISIDIGAGEVAEVPLFDGTTVRLNKAHHGYDPTDRESALAFIRDCKNRQEIATGLLYLNPEPKDFHQLNRTTKVPLRDVSFAKLVPPAETLAEFNKAFR